MQLQTTPPPSNYASTPPVTSQPPVRPSLSLPTSSPPPPTTPSTPVVNLNNPPPPAVIPPSTSASLQLQRTLDVDLVILTRCLCNHRHALNLLPYIQPEPAKQLLFAFERPRRTLDAENDLAERIISLRRNLSVSPTAANIRSHLHDRFLDLQQHSYTEISNRLTDLDTNLTKLKTSLNSSCPTSLHSFTTRLDILRHELEMASLTSPSLTSPSPIRPNPQHPPSSLPHSTPSFPFDNSNTASTSAVAYAPVNKSTSQLTTPQGLYSPNVASSDILSGGKYTSYNHPSASRPDILVPAVGPTSLIGHNTSTALRPSSQLPHSVLATSAAEQNQTHLHSQPLHNGFAPHIPPPKLDFQPSQPRLNPNAQVEHFGEADASIIGATVSAPLGYPNGSHVLPPSQAELPCNTAAPPQNPATNVVYSSQIDDAPAYVQNFANLNLEDRLQFGQPVPGAALPSSYRAKLYSGSSSPPNVIHDPSRLSQPPNLHQTASMHVPSFGRNSQHYSPSSSSGNMQQFPYESNTAGQGTPYENQPVNSSYLQPQYGAGQNAAQFPPSIPGTPGSHLGGINGTVPLHAHFDRRMAGGNADLQVAGVQTMGTPLHPRSKTMGEEWNGPGHSTGVTDPAGLASHSFPMVRPPAEGPHNFGGVPPVDGYGNGAGGYEPLGANSYGYDGAGLGNGRGRGRGRGRGHGQGQGQGQVLHGQYAGPLGHMGGGRPYGQGQVADARLIVDRHNIRHGL